MRVCLFEDRAALALEPLSLTRPVFDLLCGQTTLGSKQLRHFAPCLTGALVRPHLADLCRLTHPGLPVNDLNWLRSELTILVNARWLPPSGGEPVLTGPGIALAGDEIAYVVVSPDKLTYCSMQTLDDCLETWKQTLPNHRVGGRVFRYLWEIVDQNADQLCRDYRRYSSSHSQTGRRPSSFALIGPPERLLLDPTAQIDPLVVADTRNGPVVIDRDAVVQAFTRLEGPCYVGPHTYLQGARIRGGTTLGPGCRIGGEVEASIVLGYSNKYHDGFLGHSYLGEWVNCGAGTSNSDLRNDYGPVTVEVAGELVRTGLSKVGCFLGDHTKTGLGTLLNTGTVAGAFCNLLPTGPLTPKRIPSFCSLWNGQITDAVDVDALLRTASTVMQRRDHCFTDIHAALARTLYEETATQRRQAIREDGQRQLRRSA